MPSLLASGLAAEILTTNLQADVDAERARLLSGPASHGGADFFDDFRPLDEIETHLDTLLAAHPGLVTPIDVGTSLEGRTMRAISIHAGAPDDPTILLTATMHAREWLAATTATCLADTLARNYGTDANVTAMLDAVNIIVLPVLNPDGYVYAWDVERYWRKNRRDGIGVDLNRNFPLAWGGPGSSDVPEEENYHGTAALSEPEATALADLMIALPTLVAHLDYHTFGELLLYPWSYTGAPPSDVALLQSLAQDQVDAMEAVGGENYAALQGAELYVAAGVVDDWAYDELGLMAFVPELRPSFDGPGDFVVDPDQIVPTCQEALAGVWVLARWAGADVDVPGGTTGFGETGEPPPTTGPADADDTGPSDAGTGGTAADGGTAGGGVESGAMTTAHGHVATGGSSEGDAGQTSPTDPGCACASGRPEHAWTLSLLALLSLPALRRRDQGSSAIDRP